MNRALSFILALLLPTLAHAQYPSPTYQNLTVLGTAGLAVATVPTQSPGDSSTKAASTAFVTGALTTYAPLASPALTGTPTAPTAISSTNTTQIATTAFVKTAVAAIPASGISSFTTISAGSYTVLSTDAGKGLLFTFGSGGVNIALPQAGSAGFPAGYTVQLTAANSGNALFITTTTSTIYGSNTAPQLALYRNQTAVLISDGTNWQGYVQSPLWSSSNLGNQTITTAQPDGSTYGGNARGAWSIDLQVPSDRNFADYVASGTRSIAIGGSVKSNANFTIGVGYTANATGDSGVAVGKGSSASGASSSAYGIASNASNTSTTALGDSTSASGPNSTAIGVHATAGSASTTSLGYQANATGINSAAVGLWSYTRGVQNMYASTAIQLAGGSNSGYSQTEEIYLGVKTSGSTAVRLTADQNTAGSTNIGNLQSNSIMQYDVHITIVDTTNGNYNTYTLLGGAISNNAGTTAMATGNPAVVAGPTSASSLTLAAAPTITADATNNGFNISFTPPVANTHAITAFARIRALQLRYN